jgi:UDP-N-acetylmuramate: L-alanyl-gamma-D-glutamyl-meso-diaminopimelate ligase
MPKEYFNVGGTTSLTSIPAGSLIHVIGVCGVAMAQVAIALTERGFSVTGSDKEFYEPMRTLLSNSQVVTKTGYVAEHVPRDAALVVIGNAVSYGNPEVDVVEKLGLPYTCFPKILQEVAIAGKHSIVVCGTHGKSTTTAMIASVLLNAGRKPSYFVGGVAQGLPQSLAVGTGNVSVVEGDEYDSAFFAKVPKFSFYTPRTAIVNAIEFDHADIYPNVEAIEAEFSKMVNALPADGCAICCIDFPSVKRLVGEWKRVAQCSFITFGRDAEATYRIESRMQRGFEQQVTIAGPSGERIVFSLPLVGEYNARNALATLLAMDRVGVQRDEAIQLLGGFKRVKRRQEVRLNTGGVLLIEDFAHHPTAVKETIEAVREAFPQAVLTAVFEPRSNTSRRKVFQADYIRAFAKASRVFLKHVTARTIDAGVELLDVATLSDDISASGVPCACLPDVDAIRAAIWEKVKKDPSLGEVEVDGVREVIVVMSNGSFDGLNEKLEADLRG